MLICSLQTEHCKPAKLLVVTAKWVRCPVDCTGRISALFCLQFGTQRIARRSADWTVIIHAINESVMATLLGVGIPLEKIDHPSVRGFLRKCTTTVHPSHTIHETSTLWKKTHLQSVHSTHLKAIKHHLQCPQLKYVGHAWFSFHGGIWRKASRPTHQLRVVPCANLDHRQQVC